jgi:hypothetical protein
MDRLRSWRQPVTLNVQTSVTAIGRKIYVKVSMTDKTGIKMLEEFLLCETLK